MNTEARRQADKDRYHPADPKDYASPVGMPDVDGNGDTVFVCVGCAYCCPDTEAPLDPLEETMKVPNDDKEHRCRCGDGPFRAWESGWLPPQVVGDEGRTHLFCPSCGAEFEVVAP